MGKEKKIETGNDSFDLYADEPYDYSKIEQMVKKAHAHPEVQRNLKAYEQRKEASRRADLKKSNS